MGFMLMTELQLPWKEGIPDLGMGQGAVVRVGN